MMEDKKDGLKATLVLAPAFVFLLVFTFIPIFNALMMSLMDGFDYKEGGIFIFLNDYKMFPSINPYKIILSDPVFLQALKNTAILVVISVPLTIVISLLMAIGLNSIKRLQGLYQTIFFLPYVTNAIALGMVFNVMFSNNDYGLINRLVEFLGGTSRAWTGTQATRWNFLVVITVYTVWNGLAFKILVFMSGLQSIDKQYYDAARIDGTNKRRILSRITIPLLSPQIFYIMITSFIGAFKAYTGIVGLVGAGPSNFGGGKGDQWITIVGYIYKTMKVSEAGAYSKASAGAVILLIIILAITAVQFSVGKKRVHY